MTETELDILSIDSNIKKEFERELQNLPSYKERLQELERTVKKQLPVRVQNDLNESINKLAEKIEKIESRSEQYLYLSDTAQYIERYKKILKTPMKINFMGKPIRNNKEKNTVIQCYIEEAKKYSNITIPPKKKKYKMICPNPICLNKKNFKIIDETVYICEECGTEKRLLLHTTSYKDIDRVNISTKYSYDRKIHFRDCINCYQGKQNSTIEQKVYDNLEERFRKNHLLVGDSSTEKKIRFSKITKEHIGMFLKDLGETKHYENINLIHYNLTGKKPDNISHLEDKLLSDFDALTECYDKKFKKKIERTNFINTQYVLFQLLQRHKHPCKKEDFVMLKTIDRQSFHDDIAAATFQQLGWNMSPFY